MEPKDRATTTQQSHTPDTPLSGSQQPIISTTTDADKRMMRSFAILVGACVVISAVWFILF